VLERAIVKILKVVAAAIEPSIVQMSKVIPVAIEQLVIIERAIIEMPKVIALAIELVVKATAILVICPCHPANDQCQRCRHN
jgi:hypothetical protein